MRFVVAALVPLSLIACANIPALPTPDAPAPSPFPDAQPEPDWTRVTKRGFSLMLPPGWTINELQGVDSYVGEVTGDGARLTWDFGRYGWGLNPEDEPEHEYLVFYEDIGGFTGKLLLPVGSPGNSNAAYPPATGVHFVNIRRGQRFNLIGRGLTLEQQRVAVAIFRSIRFRS